MRWMLPVAGLVATLGCARDATSRSANDASGARRGAPALEGEASYYASSLSGHSTASGERYDPKALTAAHRTLSFGTVVRVTRRDTGDTVVVRVNDRGPFGSSHRIIDLSHAAAEQLHMIRAGVAPVRLEVLAAGKPRRH